MGTISRLFMALLFLITLSLGLVGCSHSEHPTGGDHPAKTGEAGQSDHPTKTDDAGKPEHPTNDKSEHPK